MIAVGVLLLGLANIYRVIALYRQMDLQLDLGAVPDPRFRIAAALIWTAVLIILTIGLWLRKSWTQILVPALLLLYAIYRSALIVLFAGSEYARSSQVIGITLYGIVVVFTAWALNRSAAKAYFEPENEERESSAGLEG